MNKLLQAVFESSVEGILVVKKKGTILLANPACGKMFGYTPEEMKGLDLEVLIPQGFRKKHKHLRDTYNSSPEARNMVQRRTISGLRRKGQEFPVEISLSPTTIDDEKVVIALILDVTKRQIIETTNSDYAKLIEESLSEMHIFDAETSHFILMNGVARKNLGYSMEELQLMTPADILYSYNFEEHSKLVEPLINGKVSELKVETYQQRKNGETYPIETFLQKTTFGGRVVIKALVQDISERKKAEHEIRTSLLRFKTLTQLAPIGIFLTDEKGDRLFANKKWEEITGISIEDSLGSGWVNAIFPEDKNWVFEKWKQVVSQGETLDLEYRFLNQQTNVVTEIWNLAAPIYDEDYQITNYVGVIQDITALKMARKTLLKLNVELEEKVDQQTFQLRESEERLKIAQKISKIGYWIWKTNYSYWSEGTRRILAANENDNIGVEFLMNIIHPEDHSRLEKYDKDSRLGLEVKPSEFRVQLKNGVEKWIYIENRKPKKNKAGQVVEIFGIIQDISKRKEIEKKLALALESEKDLNELKSKFVSMASHEFRTPLGVIMTAADLIALQNGSGKEEQRLKNVGRIKSNIKNLTLLLNDFLSLEKLETGKINFHPININFQEFVADILEELHAFKGSNNEIIFHHQGNNEVFIDVHLVKSILINLLSNAIKYSTKGQKVEMHSQNQNGVLHIQVKDTGLGIPKAEQKDMFTRFFRATNVENIKGTGIGLTIVKRYLDLMDGNIKFESEENQGSTFSIVIPMS